MSEDCNVPLGREEIMRERLAAFIHGAWRHWMGYMADKIDSGSQRQKRDGEHLVQGWLPRGLMERWRRQMNTEYEDLPESEKGSDREWAVTLLKLVNTAVVEGAVPAAAELNEQIEQLRVQLAACGGAALGAICDPVGPGDYGWSPAYQDALNLRRSYDRERKRNSDLVGAGQKPVDRQELLGRVSTAASRALYYTIGKTAIPFVNVDQAMAELTPALQEALVGLIIPYEEENPRPFEELLPQYVAWRMGVDEDRCPDEFDMALGWFAGKGFSHDEACKAAAHARDYDWGKEDEEG